LVIKFPLFKNIKIIQDRHNVERLITNHIHKELQLEGHYIIVPSGDVFRNWVRKKEIFDNFTFFSKERLTRIQNIHCNLNYYQKSLSLNCDLLYN